MLRDRSLEIVDDQGRTRAQILVAPAATKDGVAYPDTVVLRLIDTAGQPSVKTATSVEGAGVDILGGPDDNGWYGLQLIANAEGGTITLMNKKGPNVVIQP